MMKKNGFTLAEVLITLGIIGVIATMTLPSLMTNTAEQQAKSGLRKGINTLTEAAQLSNAIDGFDYSGLTSQATNNESDMSLYALLVNRAACDIPKSGTGKSELGAASTGNYTMFFRDGSALMFNAASTAASNARNSVRLADGLPQGFAAIYDYNGLKKPNIISNCKGATTSNGQSDNTVADANQACTKAMRVIKDQFGVRLRGSYVVPNGAAARWAFEN